MKYTDKKNVSELFNSHTNKKKLNKKNNKKRKKEKKKNKTKKKRKENFSGPSKKKLDKEFKKAINDIKEAKLRIYEADKMSNRSRKYRKEVNKKEKEFFSDMECIKERRKLAREWEKENFWSKILDLLHQVGPLLKTLAKLVANLIIAFLSIDSIKESIDTKTLNKMTTVFNLAMSF